MAIPPGSVAVWGADCDCASVPGRVTVLTPSPDGPPDERAGSSAADDHSRCGEKEGTLPVRHGIRDSRRWSRRG